MIGSEPLHTNGNVKQVPFVYCLDRKCICKIRFLISHMISDYTNTNKYLSMNCFVEDILYKDGKALHTKSVFLNLFVGMQ